MQRTGALVSVLFSFRKNGPVCSCPFYKNIGHINEGGGYPQRLNNRKGRSETVVTAKSRTRVEIHMPQNIYIYDPDVPVPYDVQHVEIPGGVTAIGNFSFSECFNLQSITIPDSVIIIGDFAFQECSELRSVTIPDSVMEIGEGAFEYCFNLRSITIPDSVMEIGGHAFRNCSGLRSITIPDSVTEIGEHAFRDCPGLRSITIPDSITKIESYTFYGCSSLQSVKIPDGITEIGNSAFQNCSNLRSVVIPNSVTKIGNGAFAGCPGLQTITIPDSVTKIEDGAFSDCSGLQSVRIPDSVTKIGHSIFYGCSGLQSVRIPDSVTKIGFGVFAGCSGLQSVTIPDRVTEIGNGAFEKCSGLRSIAIPDSVTEIGSSAFYGCSALRSVTIPDSITKICNHTFSACSGLRSVMIPDSVTEIGDNAFYGCYCLQSITIPDSVTIIPYHAFCRCPRLQNVVIPDSVIKIEHGAFMNCSALRSITIPDSVTEIENGAFGGCSALQSLMYKGVNIAPFIDTDGYGVNTFDVIRELIDHQIPLNENTVRRSIDMVHRGRLAQWIADYPVFGEMRLSPAAKSVDGKTEEYLRQLFAAQKKTGCHVPKILDKLAIAVCACGIPPERLAETFDIRYTEAVIRDGVPAVPAAACRCYYDRGTCDMLIRKDKISVMAEAISLYNRSGHRECYRHLMEFVLSHSDTKTEDLQYAADHAEEIPMRAETTLTQIRQHRTYTESLAEVTKIEEEYGETVPGFKLSDYPCNIDQIGVTYDGMTARVLDLSDEKDIALAAKLGDLTDCCQRLGKAGETAMMHGFLNSDAGFWVIEDKDGNVKAQAEIWEADGKILVFDNIEFTNTDREHLSDRADRLRGVIAAWAMESGYTNIIMGCGYNELGTGSMEQAPVPELRLTPEEVFALQKDNDAGVSFETIDEVHRYMQTEEYDPNDFVYTDAGEQCVYIKKDGIVSGYLMRGYDCTLAEKRPSPGHGATKEQGDDVACK